MAAPSLDYGTCRSYRIKIIFRKNLCRRTVLRGRHPGIFLKLQRKVLVRRVIQCICNLRKGIAVLPYHHLGGINLEA